jgi:hypothetical protein
MSTESKILALVVAVFVFWLAALSWVMAHEAPSGWSYPLACCSNRDCRMIDAEMVSVTAAGYRFTIPAGYHNMAPDGGVYVVAFSKARISPDGEFCLCLSPRQAVLCAFAPPPGS